MLTELVKKKENVAKSEGREDKKQVVKGLGSGRRYQSRSKSLDREGEEVGRQTRRHQEEA